MAGMTPASQNRPPRTIRTHGTRQPAHARKRRNTARKMAQKHGCFYAVDKTTTHATKTLKYGKMSVKTAYAKNRPRAPDNNDGKNTRATRPKTAK